MSRRKLVYSNLPDLTPHCRSDTFLPYPTVLFSLAGRESPQLLPISSQCTGTPTSETASLLQTLLFQLQRGTALQRKLEPKERSQSPLSPSLAYFSPCEAKKRQASFPRWENTPLERRDRPPAPKRRPPAPLSSLPHTHTHIYTLCFTHTQPVRK